MTNPHPCLEQLEKLSHPSTELGDQDGTEFGWIRKDLS